jgi:hypothetical protein
VAPERLVGHQRPRIFSAPPAVGSSGQEAVELAASAGLQLDPWQAWLLEQGLGEASDGRWVAFEVAMMLSRQNGKGGVLEAVALAGLFLFADRFIGWSAHEFKTAQEGFLRVRGLIDGSDDLRRRVRKVTTSHGEEGIELTTGQRLRFMARSTGSGRGFTGDRLILDEAQHLGEPAVEAILPTMSARPNPQVWYAATAPDPEIAPCEVLARLRRRALAGDDLSLVYAEWSINPHVDECPTVCHDHDDPAAPRSWAKANPALGIRNSAEHVGREMASMSAGGFARERLGVGRWPTADGAWEIISEPQWRSLADPDSQLDPAAPVAFAAAVTPDASLGTIAVIGRRPDGLLHAEVVDRRPRTSWMVGRLVELHQQWPACALVLDAVGPASPLIPGLLAGGFVRVAPHGPQPAEGWPLLTPYAREVAQAAGQLYAAVTDARDLRHLDQPEVAVALGGAVKRTVSGAWAWGQLGDGVDLTPLDAMSLALWGHACRAHLPDGPVVLEGSLMV